jgi:hypothetical protein
LTFIVYDSSRDDQVTPLPPGEGGSETRASASARNRVRGVNLAQFEIHAPHPPLACGSRHPLPVGEG